MNLRLKFAAAALRRSLPIGAPRPSAVLRRGTPRRRCRAHAVAGAHGQARLAVRGQYRHARDHQGAAGPQSAAGRSVFPPLLRRSARIRGPASANSKARAPASSSTRKNGYIITNHHVVENASEITITLLDNRTFSAKVIGSDEGADVAVLQAKQPNLVAMALGDSSKLEVGDYVVAIGNPFGSAAHGHRRHRQRAGAQRHQSRGRRLRGFHPNRRLDQPRKFRRRIGESARRIGRHQFRHPVPHRRQHRHRLRDPGEHGPAASWTNSSSTARSSAAFSACSSTASMPDIAKEFGLTETSGALVAGVAQGSAAERAGDQDRRHHHLAQRRHHEEIRRAAQRHRHAARRRQSGDRICCATANRARSPR